MTALGEKSTALLERLFASEPARIAAEKRLRDAFADDEAEPYRLVCAVLRMSCGQVERNRYTGSGRVDALESAIELLATDWRDALMAAGFGDDVEAHARWADAVLAES